MGLSRRAVRFLSLSCFGAALLATTDPLTATTYFPQAMTCPVGDEEFEAQVAASNSYFGQRPDGRPYSPTPVVPLPECPGNGLILFEEAFSDARLELLAEAIAQPEFAALRQEHVQFYRLAWLQKYIGADPYEVATPLMIAGWEADGRADLKRRYQAEFVAAVSALDPSAGEENSWFWLNLRAANALRELGRFDEAETSLQQLETSAQMPGDEDGREGALFLIRGLIRLVAEANSHPEPTNLIPSEMAASRCVEHEARLSVSEREICASDDLEDAIAEYQDFEVERIDAGSDHAPFVAAEAAATADAAMADAEANIEAALDASAARD